MADNMALHADLLAAGVGRRPRVHPPGAPFARVAAIAAAVVVAAFVVLLAAGALGLPVAQATPAQTQLTLEAKAASDRFTVLAQHQQVADDGLALAEHAWTLLAPHFPDRPPGPITIVIVENPAEYEVIQPAPMTRGFATFGGTRIYLRGDSVDQEVVTHELTHILFGLNVRPGVPIPDWFNEGLAQYASGAPESTIQLIYDRSAGRILTLQQLGAVDALQSPDRDLATTEGLAVVRFLADEYGGPRLWNLVGSLRTSSTFEQALLQTYGRTDLQLNETWMAYARQHYSLFSPLLIETLLTMLLTLLVVAAVVVWLVRRSRGLGRIGGVDLTEGERLAAHHAELLLLHPDGHGPAGPHADRPEIDTRDGAP
jgi:Peptidase MA superfamily